jgi:hypothetical protein
VTPRGQGRVGDAGWSEADTLVDHLDARIARGDGDLLRTVAVAVEAGLADQHLEAAGVVALPAENNSDAFPRSAWAVIFDRICCGQQRWSIDDINGTERDALPWVVAQIAENVLYDSRSR